MASKRRVALLAYLTLSIVPSVFLKFMAGTSSVYVGVSSTIFVRENYPSSYKNIIVEETDLGERYHPSGGNEMITMLNRSFSRKKKSGTVS